LHESVVGVGVGAAHVAAVGTIQLEESQLAPEPAFWHAEKEEEDEELPVEQYPADTRDQANMRDNAAMSEGQ